MDQFSGRRSTLATIERFTNRPGIESKSGPGPSSGDNRRCLGDNSPSWLRLYRDVPRDFYAVALAMQPPAIGVQNAVRPRVKGPHQRSISFEMSVVASTAQDPPFASCAPRPVVERHN